MSVGNDLTMAVDWPEITAALLKPARMSVWRTAAAWPGLVLVEEDKKKEGGKEEERGGGRGIRGVGESDQADPKPVQWWKDWKAKKAKERQQGLVEKPAQLVADADPDWMDKMLGLKEQDA